MLFSRIGEGLAAAWKYLIAVGPLGLFAIALLDSALIPLPAGPDAAMILLSVNQPIWYVVLLAMGATLGSVVGCLILYSISQRAGRRALKRFSAPKQARVKELLDRHDLLSMFVASILPPPFPFKIFVVSAGVFRLSVLRFALALCAGRLFRYLLEGCLAARYGEQAKDLLEHYYPFIGLGLAALVISLFIARRVWKRKSTVEKPGTEVVEEIVKADL